MKLVLENWRKYLNEKSIDCGPLYIFEGDNVKQTSFYDALHMLNENEEDSIETFLENWERSVDYHIEQLDESALADMANNPVLYLSTQAFLFLDRLKDKVIKYASKVVGIINKIRAFLQRFEKKHPTLYRIGSIAIKVIIVVLIAYVLYHIFSGGGCGLSESLQEGVCLGREAYDLDARKVTQEIIANEEQLRKVGQAAQMSERADLQEIGRKLIDMANSPNDFHAGYDISGDTLKILKHGVATLEKTELRNVAQKAAEGAMEASASTPKNIIQALQNTASQGGEAGEVALKQLEMLGQGQTVQQVMSKAAQGKI